MVPCGTSAYLATPHAERLYSDVVSLYTMSNDQKIKSSSWTAKQQCCLTVKLFLVRAKTITKGNGGAYRDRTDDPLLAKQVLSQLS